MGLFAVRDRYSVLPGLPCVCSLAGWKVMSEMFQWTGEPFLSTPECVPCERRLRVEAIDPDQLGSLGLDEDVKTIARCDLCETTYVVERNE